MSNNFAPDYVDVATRVAEFRTKHPEGSLQPADPAVPYRIETIGGDTYISVVAAAYRHPEDPRPGIGMAYECFPGKTPYTRGSELQNAETSAWGRAIMAALAADSRRGIASADEVRNRDAERGQGKPEPSGRDWLVEVADAATEGDLRRIYEQCAAYSEGSPEIEEAIKVRKAQIVAADDPWTSPATPEQGALV